MTVAACGCTGAGMDWESSNCREGHGSPYVVAERKRNGLRSLQLSAIAQEVWAEAMRATTLYAPMNSCHEAEAVIREEFDEYWDEVKAYNLHKGRDTRPKQRAELIQLAAMAVRAIYDTIDNGREHGEIVGVPTPSPNASC